MSVEAPNGIKFNSIVTASNRNQRDTDGWFQALFHQAAQNQSSPPESPKKSTQWMAYYGASETNQADAQHKMSMLDQDGLLKFTHVQPHQERGLNQVLQSLATKPKVKHLIIRDSLLAHHHLQTVSEVLKHNDGLAWLVLDHNAIDDRGIRHLSEGLKGAVGIRHVVLSDNHIGVEGAHELANVLTHNKGIETLWLQGNKITDSPAKALVHAATDHPTLKTISLIGNPISHQQKTDFSAKQCFNCRIMV